MPGEAVTASYRTRAVAGLLAGILMALLGWHIATGITATSLLDLVFDGPAPTGTWTVALVFRDKECPEHMDLIEELNHPAVGGLRVQGILLVEPGKFERWEDLVAANRITFPVRPAPPARARSALGTTRTPALLVYGPDGRLRLLTDLTDADLLRALLVRLRSLASHPSRET